MEAWAGQSTHRLSELQAFDAMRAFIEAYWERGGKQSDDIAVLLGSLNRDNGPPLDPAQWHDWLIVVAKHKPVEKRE
jgi:hypothetical protein